MVAKTAEARYPTMAEVIADLERCRLSTMAVSPAVSIAAAEDARLEEFLREIVAPSHPRSAPARPASHGAAVAVAAKPAPVADPDETLTYAGPQAICQNRQQKSLCRCPSWGRQTRRE